MDLNETLFTRMLVKSYREGTDEEKWRAAEEVAVTKEANGYALWYGGGEFHPPRVIAWGREKNDIIAYAAKIGVMDVRGLAGRCLIEHKIPRLFDQAMEPVALEK